MSFLFLPKKNSMEARFYYRLLGEKLKKLKELHDKDLKFKRRQDLQFAQDMFLQTHGGLPKAFSVLEAEKLGIQIAETGLPLSVCSHPQCPSFLQSLGPAPISKSEKIACDKFGRPVCTKEGCKAKGLEMVWCNAQRSEHFGLNEWTKEPFFFACLKCKTILPRPGAKEVDFNTGRKYLYNHLAPLFYPTRSYAKVFAG